MRAADAAAGTGPGVVQELLAAVRSEGLLAPGRPVLVMLSGGRDSSCLLDLAVAVAGAQAVGALHVNYGLREAAQADEEHCRALCARLGVALAVRHAGPRPASGNLQDWARRLRYDAASALARERAADVAAGHTATDQVETVLYRLAAAPSRRALLGMRAREGKLIRPLLRFTREQTGAYCQARGLGWRDDESNDTDAYARSRVRHGLIPALRAVHPGAERNVLALLEQLRDEAEVLDALVDAELEGRDAVELGHLRALPRALARLVVQRLADAVNGRPTPGSARRLDDILALGDAGAAHLDLPGGVRASVADGLLSFSATPPLARRRPSPQPSTAPQGLRPTARRGSSRQPPGGF